MSLHIGIILDGNGRWATKQGKPRLFGHRTAVNSLKTLVRDARGIGVSSMTLFAFAIANWKRDKEEVDGLWQIFNHFFETHIAELAQEGIRIHVIGDRAGLPPDILEKIQKVEKQSLANDAFMLQIALNYDGVDEVARLLKRSIENGIDPNDVTSEYVLSHLDTLLGTEPDILIRTGLPAPQDGMNIWRSSAFLPLQSAQSVCVGTEVLLPDFNIEHLKKIIAYADPDSRLFGGQRREK